MNRTLVFMALILSAEMAAFPQAGGMPGSAGASLNLPDAVRLALQNRPEVLLAEAQAARSREAVRESRSFNLPQVTLGSGLAYNNGFPLSVETSAPSLFELGSSMPILNKQNKYRIREAEESSLASQVGVEAVRNDLAATVAMAYSSYHQSQRTEALWSHRLEVAVREQARWEDLEKAGRARPLDVLLARTTAATVRQRLLEAQERSRLAGAQLRDLLGLPDGAPLSTAEPQLPPAALRLTMDELLQQALKANPAIRQAESQVRGKEHRIQAEQGNRYPRLDLVGRYALFSKQNNYQDYYNRFTRNNFLVGVSIEVPVFTGFRTSARIAQSQSEAAEARYRLQQLKSGLKMDLERSASAMRVAEGALELARAEFDTARESLSVQESLQEQGRAEPKEAEAARDLLATREIGMIEAEAALFQRQVELLRVCGLLAGLFEIPA